MDNDWKIVTGGGRRTKIDDADLAVGKLKVFRVVEQLGPWSPQTEALLRRRQRPVVVINGQTVVLVANPTSTVQHWIQNHDILTACEFVDVETGRCCRPRAQDVAELQSSVVQLLSALATGGGGPLWTPIHVHLQPARLQPTLLGYLLGYPVLYYCPSNGGRTRLEFPLVQYSVRAAAAVDCWQFTVPASELDTLKPKISHWIESLSTGVQIEVTEKGLNEVCL